MPSTKSRVHPKYKTKYRVSNWPDYDRSLVEHGNLMARSTLSIESGS
jgi:hypothetical protein